MSNDPGRAAGRLMSGTSRSGRLDGTSRPEMSGTLRRVSSVRDGFPATVLNTLTEREDPSV
jgi:hypothetical protein